MMRRRTATTLMLGLLASCSTPKAKIIGKQIPVLPETGGLEIAQDAPQVSVPAPVALDNWPQLLANAAHLPANLGRQAVDTAETTGHVAQVVRIVGPEKKAVGADGFALGLGL